MMFKIFATLSLAFYLPIFFPSFFLADQLFLFNYYVYLRPALLLLPIAAAYFCARQSEGTWFVKLARALALASVACALEYLHHQRVDLGFHHFHFFPRSNMAWQEQIHPEILRLNPWERPHSYRILADCLVAWINLLAHDFHFAKEIYRVTTMILFVFAIFRFARIYLREFGAWACVLGYALVYPISIRYYHGQLLDPLSHLSFVAGFLFLHQRKWGWLAFAVFHGALAKESILVLPLFAAWIYRREKYGVVRGLSLFLLALVPIVSIRLYLNNWHLPGYGAISGTTPSWLLLNLHSNDWVNQNFWALGVFLPFLLLRFRRTEKFLRELALVMAVAVSGSNLLFSWLYEVRNYIPATVPLLVITVLFFGDLTQFIARKLPGENSGSPSRPS